MDQILQGLNAALANVAARTQRGIVQVRSGRYGAGTGIVVADGLILTNAHVVRAGRMQVQPPGGRARAARLVGYEAALDLAVLQVDGAGLAALPLGDSRALRPGQWVMAVGYPWGVAGATTAGVLLGSGRDWSRGPLQGRDWIVADLHLRPGNSGGPLVDAAGRVVGVNTMVAGPDVGIAVPVHVARAFLDALAVPEVGERRVH